MATALAPLVAPIVGAARTHRVRLTGAARGWGAGGFVIEFGGGCYQDTYPDVSCVYPAGYTYPDVS